MRPFPHLDRLHDIPSPADPDKAKGALEELRKALRSTPAGADFAACLEKHEEGRRLAACVAGSSPFLERILRHDPEFIATVMRDGPDDTMRAIELELMALDTGEQPSAVARALRMARRRAAFTIAIADIGNLWELDQVVEALSAFAICAVRTAVRCVLAGAIARFELVVPDPSDPEAGSGYIVLAMGKLGARELNFSSDIDLIVLYDPEAADYRGTRPMQDFFVRLTRDMVKLLHERTVDGYVFRTDLRLRPDAGATRLALSTIAAEVYYESQGQNWERAAMIKASPIAGDLAAGKAFLDGIAPFMWRRHLDFTAIQDIHSIKRQIHDRMGHTEIEARGHDIKLGRGGIREIEFFAQTQQLISGGREPRLRVASTQGAIRALAQTGQISARTADELTAAYRFLRRVEHRLQMLNDEQTQTLPENAAEFDAFARFLGYPSGVEFRAELIAVLTTVSSHYADLFEEAPPLGAEGSLSFTGTEDDPETLATLRRLGFGDPEVVTARMRAWHHGRFRATRSTRARELLTELGPAILASLGKSSAPDEAFLRFDEFLSKLPAGVQVFSLFHAHPGVLDLVTEILGNAPRLAEILTRSPHLLDAVLSADFFDRLPEQNELRDSLERTLGVARDYQDVLDVARRWAADHRFQAGVHILRGRAHADAAGPTLSAVAEVAVRALLPHVEADFARTHGRVPDGGIAIVGLGKLGGREMAPASDLDLVFVYDCPAEAVASDGKRPLPVSRYFARLSQRFIAALTAMTGEGRLYEVDMRLRPSGHAGPIAVALDAFRGYQRESAWIWEHMALTRARPVCGPKELCDAVEQELRKILTRPRDPSKLAADVIEMRARIAREHGTKNSWSIKYVRGGLIDLEFIAQYLQLRYAEARPRILDTNTSQAFAKLADAGLIPAAVAQDLIDATVLARNVQGLIRLSHDAEPRDDGFSAGFAAALARAGGTGDLAELKARLVERQARVAELFDELVGPVGPP